MRLLKTREITYSRISRALCRILLSISAEQLEDARQNQYACYARILGFQKSAAPLLSSIKKNSAIPLISKPADASKRLSPDAMRMFEKDVLASHMWENAVYRKRTAAHALKSAAAVTKPVHEYTRQIIIV